MTRLMRELAGQDPNRIVIVDAPPLHAGTEASVLARMVGHVVVLVEADKTPQSSVADALHQLKGIESVSMILNKARRRSSDHVAYGYGYGYGSQGS
jgi:Mrp family chromosome partitioning ATPase